uniref:phenylalanine--tRNA ligase n=1 Tax=Riquetophycus sp. TaxID=1897556 RepID=A0A1C9C8C1_9FLOR|nr:phenylalanyl-tRNA synthetase beta chain [Riquetophycus sp.]
MKFSWKLLNEFVDLHQIPFKHIIEQLTLSGFEVEEIDDKPEIDDKIISISIPANRSDADSIIGIAREISTILNINLKNICIDQNNTQSYSSGYVKNLNSEILLDLQVNVITLLKQNTSPKWLRNYLKVYDIKSQNILHDIAEYINVKWGQDIEIFDLGDVPSNINYKKTIKLKRQYKDTQDINESVDLKNIYKLPYCEIIYYNKEILSVLGLQSNSKFICNEKSKNIIILGQICSPSYIRNAFSHIKSKTDTINKHLKNIIRSDFNSAYDELIYLILTLNQGSTEKLYKYKKHYINNKIIKIYPQNIVKTLGPCKKSNELILSNQTIKNILAQLKFIIHNNADHLLVQIPEHRQADINREIDIIEEVARIYGFDKFIDELPSNNRLGSTPYIIKLIKKIRHILRNIGLHEVVHYSLEKQSNNNINNINIYNPLIYDQSRLKISLVQQLINTAIYNKKQKNSPIEYFEIGKIFYKVQKQDNEFKYLENIHIAGIIGNHNFSRRLWNEKNYELTWFQAKGIMEDFFEKLNANVIWIQHYKAINNIMEDIIIKVCHPYRTAILCNASTKKIIGIFGQLNTKLKNDLGNTHTTYIFEINLEDLEDTISHNKHLAYNAKRYSLYPSVTRDISIVMNKNDSTEHIKKKILAYSKMCIESIEVFNEYTTYKLNKKNRSVGFRITYRLNNRTLNDKDIHNIDQEINNLMSI